MPHKVHRSVHRTAIVFGVLLVLILAHLVFLFAQSRHSTSHSLRAEGRWVAVRRSLHLPPPKLTYKIPSLSLPAASRFDLKRKRALEESLSFSFADVDAPSQLYFAADALLDKTVSHQQILEGFRVILAEEKENAGRKSKNSVRVKGQGN
ncbi:hypothetical protein DFH07DRAFT_971289 [Mycena maculata]|uniref:Uncharacterized protein n=1 Tax=Mycena maculata TaxID=230809 RepID=A0AAD7HP13_9AGAR|nr:hypothetical protein DFH07DRAFT_971289 [Mycena maculata]